MCCAWGFPLSFDGGVSIDKTAEISKWNYLNTAQSRNPGKAESHHAKIQFLQQVIAQWPRDGGPQKSDQRSDSPRNHQEHLLQMPPAHFPREAFSPCPTCRKHRGRSRGEGRDHILPIPPTELEEVDPSGGHCSGLSSWIYGPGEIRNPASRHWTC